MRPLKQRLTEIVHSLGGGITVLNALGGVILIAILLTARWLPFPKWFAVLCVLVAMLIPIFRNADFANTSWLEFSDDFIVSRRPDMERLTSGIAGLTLVLIFGVLGWKMSTISPAFDEPTILIVTSFLVVPFAWLAAYLLCAREITLDLTRRRYQYRLSLLILLKLREGSLDEIGGIQMMDNSYGYPPYFVFLEWKKPNTRKTVIARSSSRSPEYITAQAQKVAAILDVPYTPAPERSGVYRR